MTEYPIILPKAVLQEAAGADPSALRDVKMINLPKPADCPECGSEPTSQVIDLAGKPTRVWVACEHQVVAFNATTSLEARLASLGRLEAKHGAWPVPKKFSGVKLSDVKVPAPGTEDDPEADYVGSVKGLAVARWYVDNLDVAIAEGYGALLHGKRGTAKTMITAAIVNEARDRGYYAVWTQIKGLYDRLCNIERRVAILDAIAAADILVLDELVGEKDTAASLREFMRLVDVRYLSERSTFITSNFDVAYIQQHLLTVLGRENSAEASAEMVGRFLSRLQPPSYRRVPFNGPDMRLRERSSWGPEID
jgi:DNA replication protein DnaC